MGEKEMTLESEKIRAIPMVHWCQWRPFLSPLTPVESICEYWTTLVLPPLMGSPPPPTPSFARFCDTLISSTVI